MVGAPVFEKYLSICGENSTLENKGGLLGPSSLHQDPFPHVLNIWAQGINKSSFVSSSVWRTCTCHLLLPVKQKPKHIIKQMIRDLEPVSEVTDFYRSKSHLAANVVSP